MRQWRYQPYLLNGEPVEVETTVNVQFTLALAKLGELAESKGLANYGGANRQSEDAEARNGGLGQLEIAMGHL